MQMSLDGFIEGPKERWTGLLAGKKTGKKCSKILNLSILTCLGARCITAMQLTGGRF
jgi:hypothetical protein